MDMTVFLLMIFIIIILVHQKNILEESKYYPQENNFFTRNDSTFMAEEVFHSIKRERNERKTNMERKKRLKKEVKNRKKIFIFKNAESEEETENLVSFRDLLKDNFINKIILVSLEDLNLKLYDDEDDSAIEEIFLLDDNPDNIPIIFYGGDYEDFLEFLFICGWEDRLDMEWVENPWDVNNLKEVIKQISKR